MKKISEIMENIDGKLILDFSNLSSNNDYLVSIDDKLINVDLKEKYVFPLSQISTHNNQQIKPLTVWLRALLLLFIKKYIIFHKERADCYPISEAV